MYTAKIEINNELLKLLEAENNWDKDRSSLVIKGNTVIIKAKDIIAFKATINGLIKLIESYERTSSLVKNG